MTRDVLVWSDVYFQINPHGQQSIVAGVLGAELALDTSWSPYGRLRLTVPLDEALADAIDPVRQDTTSQAVLTLWRRPRDEHPEQQYQFYLNVRNVSRNYSNGTMRVEAATEEAIADAYAYHETSPMVWPAGTAVTVAVNNVLTKLSGGLDPASAPTPDTLEEEVTWEAGTTASQMLQTLVGPTGRKILADTDGRWLLVDPALPVTPGPTEPRRYSFADFIEYEARAALDAGHYADNVVTVYEWTDDDGAQRQRVYTAESEALDPTWHVERIRSRPVGGKAAAALQGRLSLWGRERTWRMAWDLDLRPGVPVLVEHPDGTLTRGLTQAVTYREDGTMTVTATEEPYDTGWIDLSASLEAPATGGTLWCRRVGSTVEVVGNLSGSFADGAVTNVAPVGTVPADCRPGSPGGELAAGVGYATSGYVAGALVRADGSVAYWMRSGQSARSTVQFSVTYLTAN